MRRVTLGVLAPPRSAVGLPTVAMGLVFGLAVLTSAHVAAAHELTPDQLREVSVDQRLGAEVQ